MVPVTDRNKAMTFVEREAALRAEIDRTEGGRPEHLRALADCIRWILTTCNGQPWPQLVLELLYDYQRMVRIHLKWIERGRPAILNRVPTLCSMDSVRPVAAFPPTKWMKVAEDLDLVASLLERPNRSKAMPKTRIAELLSLTVDQLTRVHGDSLVKESRKLWRIDLDRLDAADRKAIENAPPRAKGRPRGRAKE